MMGTEFGDYVATFEPDDVAFFEAALALAEKVGGTLGLARGGRLVITLPADSPRADAVAAQITNDDFPFCYVIAGTDSHLVFDL